MPHLPTVASYVFPSGTLHTPLLSVSDLCSHGCTATFTSNGVTVACPDTPSVFFGKDVSDTMYDIGRTPGVVLDTTPVHRGFAGYDHGHIQLAQQNFTYPGHAHLAMNARNQTNADKVRFVSASFCCTPDSTLARDFAKGWIQHWPTDVTAAMIRANPTAFTATAFGHMEQVRMYNDKHSKPDSLQGQTPPRDPITFDFAGDYDNPADDEAPDSLVLLSVENTLYSDWNAKFPWLSDMGNQYILTFKYRNYIHFEVAPTLTAFQHLEAFKRAFTFFSALNCTIKHKFLDNQLAQEIIDLFKASDITVHKCPPKIHRANDAEGCIKHGKAHLISMFANADPTFEVKAHWDDLIKAAEFTINHLRGWAPTRYISAWEGLHGAPHDFSAHPIAPPGTRVITYNPRDDTANRTSWGYHGQVAHYSPPIGHTPNSYRTHLVRVIGSTQTRNSAQIAWFPHNTHMPGWSTSERILAAIIDLTNAIQTAAIDNPAMTEALPHMSQALNELRSLYRRFQLTNALAYPAPPVMAPDSPFLRAVAAAQEQGLSAIQHLNHAEKQQQYQQQRFADYLARQQAAERAAIIAPEVPVIAAPVAAPAVDIVAPIPVPVPVVAPAAPVDAPAPVPPPAALPAAASLGTLPRRARARKGTTAVPTVPATAPAPVVLAPAPLVAPVPATNPPRRSQRTRRRSQKGQLMSVTTSNPLLVDDRPRTPTAPQPPAPPATLLSTTPEPKRGWKPKERPPRRPRQSHGARPPRVPDAGTPPRVPSGAAPPRVSSGEAPPRVPKSEVQQHHTDMARHVVIANVIASQAAHQATVVGVLLDTR